MVELFRTWQIKEARANFSTVIDRAISEGPQVITRNGKKMVIIVSADEWERRRRPVSDLVEFFAGSPLRGEDLHIARATDYPREIKF